MASELGGRADKLGNEFERLWVVRHLVELVAGRAMAVRIECLGDDEKGTEFWVTRPDGTREAHQCKRENASKGRWTIAALEAKRVISHAKFQLDRDPAHRFVFVSGDKAPHLADLCERAAMRQSPSEFRAHSVTTSQQLLREFRTLSFYLKVDPDEPSGVARALDFLRRFLPLSEDKLTLRGRVEDLASAWLTGDPALAVAALKDFADKSIGLTIRADDVIGALPDGIRSRDLSREPTLALRLDALRERFDRSYRHLLIGGAVLKRRETEDLWQSVIEQSPARAVLLHGPGGGGKSGVVFEFVERLRGRGLPYLPLRLDRDWPGDSPLEFGRQLDLPGSPAACLAAVAAGELGVLILDQVDAIRWTSAHSSHAWDTCERVVSEALRHPNLRVVVVCRSFDVEDDPRLRAWKAESKAEEVKVGMLDDETLDRVVAACGAKPSALLPAQRQVLRSTQALYLWSVLYESAGPGFSFRSFADLMREFWAQTRKKLRGLKPGSYDEVLEALVEYLDKRGAMAAPRTLLSRWRSEADALISMNVLVADQGKVVFAHQSYLDHLMAERVLQEVHTGSGTVLGWLKTNDQSLFRRGQLRQLLALLRDDDPARYEESLKTLFTSEAVRFHLKHLALVLLGQADPPTAGEADLATALLREEKWLDHVIDLVVAGRDAWIDALHARGVLARWLDGGDEGLERRALYLLSRVSESRGEIIEALLLDRRRDKRWEKLERVLWMSAPDQLSPRLFQVFVRMTQSGSRSLLHSIRWKALATTNASRCIEVFEAVMLGEARRARSTMAHEPIQRQETRSSRREDVNHVAAAAAAIPIDAWDRLVPLLVRILRALAASRRTRSAVGFSSRYFFEQQLSRIALGVTRALRAAGRTMVATDAAAFWQRVDRLSKMPSAATARLLAHCMAAGNDDQADVSLQWLIADRSRLRCGSRRGGFYAPAYRLLRRYSRLSSDHVFSDVLSVILAHRPEAEKRQFLHHHELLIESFRAPRGRPVAGVLGYNWNGLGQYLLLAALPQSRLAGEANSRLSVYRRKFGPAAPLLRRSPTNSGGWVRSTIPEDRLSRLSDRHWLNVIEGRWEGRPRRSRQMGPDRVGEATVDAFARDLGSMTKFDPRRFARLALAIPKSADPRYARAILQNLGDTQPPSNHKRPEVWQAATVEEIEAAVDHFGGLKDDEEFAKAFSWAIVGRSTEPWSAGTFEWLARTAISHPHPREGDYSVYTGGKPDGSFSRGQPDILGTSINCVRGVLAEAIQAILFARRDARGIFDSAVKALARDPHPSVRVAAIGLALPLFNIDREAAVATFLAACAHESDEVLRARYVNDFLRYTILKHVDELGPLIERMMRSPIAEVAQTGGGWVAVGWAHSGIWEDRLDRCLGGSKQLREGVSRALALAVANECSNPKATEVLCALFNDPEKDVRAGAASFFASDGAFKIAAARSVAQRFSESTALDDNMNDLLMGLEHHAGLLKDYAQVVFAMADRLAGPLAAEARDHQTQRPLDAEMLAKVLLRLYEQAEYENEIRARCLDAWDSLISQRIGLDALRQIDT
jgi:hypothetical protein